MRWFYAAEQNAESLRPHRTSLVLSFFGLTLLLDCLSRAIAPGYLNLQMAPILLFSIFLITSPEMHRLRNFGSLFMTLGLCILLTVALEAQLRLTEAAFQLYR